MWCTRWFLPLLLLPLPTAPPYFLVLFILSLTIHAKPCFYCIVLLTTLFVSSCYWQPFPLDNPLTVPWSHDITTFSAALNASLPANYSQPLPSVMRAVDRCWCDFSGNFFEPFNISRWEHLAVQRVAQDLEHKKLEPTSMANDQENANDGDHEQPENATLLTANFWSRFRFYPLPRSDAPVSSASSPKLMPKTHMPLQSASPPTPPALQAEIAQQPLPLFRTKYDLRPYGLGMVIDFSWSS